jgi:hypothetical protein
MHLLVDSTGLKLYGAGEWLVEKRGGSVALNSRFRRDKWSPAGFRLLRIAAAG